MFINGFRIYIQIRLGPPFGWGMVACRVEREFLISSLSSQRALSCMFVDPCPTELPAETFRMAASTRFCPIYSISALNCSWRCLLAFASSCGSLVIMSRTHWRPLIKSNNEVNRWKPSNLDWLCLRLFNHPSNWIRTPNEGKHGIRLRLGSSSRIAYYPKYYHVEPCTAVCHSSSVQK